MAKPLMFVPPLVFAALAGVFYWGMQSKDPTSIPSVFVGHEAPPVEAQPLANLPSFTDADLRSGKVVLVNFFASWCAPCRVEHPNLEALSKEGVSVYGVNWKDKPEQALGFLNSLGNPYTGIRQDPANKMGIDWGVAGVPETFVIDGKGKVLMRYAGPLTEQVVATKIRPLLEGGTAAN